VSFAGPIEDRSSIDAKVVCHLQDGEVRRAFQRTLEKQGMKIKTGTKVREQVHTGVKLKQQGMKLRHGFAVHKGTKIHRWMDAYRLMSSY